MPAITYNLNVPNPPNNPSQDVTPMQTNTNAVDSWTQVDHYKFASGFAGEHAQLSFPAWGSSTVPIGTANEGAVVYTAAGIASATTSQLYFKNNFSVPLPLTAVKAFGVFNILNASGAITPTNSANIASITQTGTGSSGTTYAIGLTGNTVNSNDIAVFISATANVTNQNAVFTWTFVNPTLTITQNLVSFTSAKISFMILQI